MTVFHGFQGQQQNRDRGVVPPERHTKGYFRDIYLDVVTVK